MNICMCICMYVHMYDVIHVSIQGVARASTGNGFVNILKLFSMNTGNFNQTSKQII